MSNEVLGQKISDAEWNVLRDKSIDELTNKTLADKANQHVRESNAPNTILEGSRTNLSDPMVALRHYGITPPEQMDEAGIASIVAQLKLKGCDQLLAEHIGQHLTEATTSQSLKPEQRERLTTNVLAHVAAKTPGITKGADTPEA